MIGPQLGGQMEEEQQGEGPAAERGGGASGRGRLEAALRAALATSA